MQTTDRAGPVPDRGGRPPTRGSRRRRSDSGVLGPQPAADQLTVTVAVGASLFDDRFGLRRQATQAAPGDGHLPRRRPRPGPVPRRPDADDRRAGTPDTVLHALRDLLRAHPGALQPRWRIDAFGSPPRPAGTPRNLMGFMDGTANPDPPTRPRRPAGLGRRRPGEPAWTAGGSYQVVRVIRMFVEFWDRVGISEQERMIGRRTRHRRAAHRDRSRRTCPTTPTTRPER